MTFCPFLRDLHHFGRGGRRIRFQECLCDYDKEGFSKVNGRNNYKTEQGIHRTQKLTTNRNPQQNKA